LDAPTTHSYSTSALLLSPTTLHLYLPDHTITPLYSQATTYLSKFTSLCLESGTLDYGLPTVTSKDSGDQQMLGAAYSWGNAGEVSTAIKSLETKVDSVHSLLIERQALQQGRQEALRTRRQEMSRLDRELAEKFILLERNRGDWERNVRNWDYQAALEVKEQLHQEAHNRLQSVNQLKESLANDFPALESLLSNEVAEC
jgi:hypothetical protein